MSLKSQIAEIFKPNDPPRQHNIGDKIHFIAEYRGQMTLFWGEIIGWWDYPDGTRTAKVQARWFNEYGNVYGGTREVYEDQLIPPAEFKHIMEVA